MTVYILSLDTSTEACSVALSCDKQIIHSEQIAPRQHNQLLLKMLDALLAEAGINLTQINVLAFGAGPGSFTGLRIASGVIQAIAFAHDLPVIPVSTLRVLAQGAYRESQSHFVLSALDAVMGEIYWGLYRLNSANIMEALRPDSICKPPEIVYPHEHEWVGIGGGWDLYSAILPEKLGKHLKQVFLQRYPLARDIITLAAYDYHLGLTVPAEKALPVYLRDELYKK